QSLAKKILKGIEPFYDENIIEVKPAMKREELIDEKESVVFVASSGMLTGGPSTYYAEKIAAMENGYIAITGYQDEEAPGKHLLDLLDAEEGERYLKLNGVSFPVKCKIKKIGLSAHSDKNEICGVIERLSARNVIFVHGNEDVIRNLAKEIAANYRGRIFAPDCGEQITISIKNPRKQIIKELPYVMQRKEELSEQNIMHFHHYIWEHYQQQLFTLNELFYLWSGIKSTDEDKLDPFQQVLLNTVYFENDRKRLFLWKAREEKDIALDLEKKEPTQQQLGSKVEEMFRGYPYKKISYSNENRSITLGFDFPDALDQSIETTFRQFTEETGWSITINENMNFNAAEMMIRGYFGYENVDRISYFIVNKRYQVVLKKAPETLQSKKLCDDFLKNTGWELVITSQDQTADVT
ncbi:MAG TPA: MBL fold metallo-hydrolase, partial [Lachnospiraceae bacterium]|nr:MBL fold metallo-hydrolase [Lachnospiraceae bacterium]